MQNNLFYFYFFPSDKDQFIIRWTRAVKFQFNRQNISFYSFSIILVKRDAASLDNESELSFEVEGLCWSSATTVLKQIPMKAWSILTEVNKQVKIPGLQGCTLKSWRLRSSWASPPPSLSVPASLLTWQALQSDILQHGLRHNKGWTC